MVIRLGGRLHDLLRETQVRPGLHCSLRSHCQSGWPVEVWPSISRTLSFVLTAFCETGNFEDCSRRLGWGAAPGDGGGFLWGWHSTDSVWKASVVDHTIIYRQTVSYLEGGKERKRERGYIGTWESEEATGTAVSVPTPTLRSWAWLVTAWWRRWCWAQGGGGGECDGAASL